MIELNLILGSMFSGKSSMLIQKISEYEAIGKKTLLINSALDTRCAKNEIKTHSNKIKKGLKVNKLMQLLKNKQFLEAEIIGIDEANFFGDLYNFIN